MQTDNTNRIFGLDIMRAFAIMLVVCSHALWIVPGAQGMIPDMLKLAGMIGVEIFFVLSGFLIGRIMYRMYLKDDFSFKDVLQFWIRRWFRTLPNYYLILLVNAVIVVFIGYGLPEGFWKYTLFLQNFACEMPLFFLESWSLSIEEFAYLVLPALLFFTLFIKAKISKSKVFLLLTVFVLLFFMLTKLLYNFNAAGSDMLFWNSNLKSVVIYRIDAIYYGVLAAYISIIRPDFWKQSRYVAFALGILIFLALNILIPLKQLYIQTNPQFWNVWYLIINSVAIMLALPLLSTIKQASKTVLKPITFISLISYGMYLLHYSVILQLLKYFIPSDTLSGFDIVVYVVVYFLLTIVASYLLYTCYEKPMMNLRNKRIFKIKA